jgi:glycosyltransferase involved in cell wall biosynthesis
MHITVCICTYKRPVLLKRLLNDSIRLESHGEFTFSIVVADNDDQQSGREVALECAANSPVKIAYFSEPQRSISYARNKTLENATGDAIAFIDDDEFPDKEWLFNLFKAWRDYKVAGVLGPVRPHFNDQAPAWVRRGGFYDRLEHKTGFAISWEEGRTGNVLFSREIIRGIDPVFDPAFGAAGGDTDFFRRMIDLGHRFIWCNEAVVYEEVPPNRCKRGFLLRRALLRGASSFKHPEGRWAGLAKAVIAIPLYVIALPILLLRGHHMFMLYLVKLCDHIGRLLAAVGIEPVRIREM